MNEVEMKQLFDVIFMMMISFVMVMALVYGSYKGVTIAWKKHKKSKTLKKIQTYINNREFQKIITFDHEGLPVLVEIMEKKEKKIISL
jgi:uncharacterized membrane protein